MRSVRRDLLPVSPDELEHAMAAAIRAVSRRETTPADDALIHLAAEHVARHLATAGIMSFRQGAPRRRAARVLERTARLRVRLVDAALSLSDVLPARSRHA